MSTRKVNYLQWSRVSAMAVRDRRLTSEQVRTLNALSIYVDAEGKAWPKMEDLEEDLGKSRQSISADLRALKKYGYVNWKRVKNESGKYFHNVYTTYLIDDANNADAEYYTGKRDKRTRKNLDTWREQSIIDAVTEPCKDGLTNICKTVLQTSERRSLQEHPIEHPSNNPLALESFDSPADDIPPDNPNITIPDEDNMIENSAVSKAEYPKRSTHRRGARLPKGTGRKYALFDPETGEAH